MLTTTLKKFPKTNLFLTIGVVFVFLLIFALLAIRFFSLNNKYQQLLHKRRILENEFANLKTENTATQKELTDLKNEDQYLINKKLEEEIKNIRNTYQGAVSSYEKLLTFKEKSKKTDEFDKMFTAALTYLSNKNYASAEATLKNLNSKIDQETEKIAAAFAIPQNVMVNNAPPASGYQRQRVETDEGGFMTDIICGDLSSTKVIVDTASEGNCSANCPVLSLAEYVSRNGAFAGVNGSYFCPSSYPSCAGKENSFDTLLMNKNKVYFNSENNVYSTVPAVIFGDSWIRFVGQSLEWGRDTGVNGVLANQPLLVSGGNIVFGGDGDAKKGSRGGRSFVANKGSIVYIGVVYNATVAQSAKVMKALGMENALNLDDGGSTALWYGGYKAGPGRNIANAILFVRK